MTLSKNIVFVHVPKAGGSSVRSFIARQVNRDDIFPETELHHFPRYERLEPRAPMLFMSHLGFEFVRAAQADCFVLMRHPIERLLSLYSYSQHPGGNVPVISPQISSGKTVLEFFNSDHPAIRMNIDNAQTWQIASGYSARHRELRLKNGATMDRISAQAIRNLGEFQVVGTLEDMPGFYRSVAAYFGNHDADLPDRVQNKSQKRVLWKELSEAEKTAIERCVSDEWALYDAARSLSAP
ncbi:sulfotransferase family 2 domain-containing protein [Shimia sp.]|uniref:sulfotransferase family 2 domain-containing protein n=1 Tax=Shimia sp. TaxID=1954381 RepID=UPI00356833D4